MSYSIFFISQKNNKKKKIAKAFKANAKDGQIQV